MKQKNVWGNAKLSEIAPRQLEKNQHMIKILILILALEKALLNKHSHSAH